MKMLKRISARTGTSQKGSTAIESGWSMGFDAGAKTQLGADKKEIFDRLVPFAFLGEGFMMAVFSPEEYQQLGGNK